MRESLNKIFFEHGYADFKWMEPADIVVGQLVRMKCTFGCDEYGKTATCPPHVPSIEECRRFFAEYRHGVILHFEKSLDKPEDRHAWSRDMNRKLLALERAVFLSGFPKTFLLFMDSCGLCSECAGTRAECKLPLEARPSPEALGMDVFSTVRKYGYPIEVLADYDRTMHRYAFLLIE
jgi:predicted metal-binding protein